MATFISQIHLPTLLSLPFLIFSYILNIYQQNCSAFITACPPFRLCFYPSTFLPSFPPRLFISLHHSICLHNFSLSSPPFPSPSPQHSTSILYPLFLSACASSCIASIPQILLSLTFTLPIFPISGSPPLPLPCFFMQKLQNSKGHGAMGKLCN